jgi:hypothetical protein
MWAKKAQGIGNGRFETLALTKNIRQISRTVPTACLL